MHVLVLAYYFPPLGGAGVQRTAKLVKHLPSSGYRATVVTGPESTALDFAPADATLAAEVPREAAVRRLPEPVARDSRVAGRLRRWLGIPTPFARWWIDGVVATAAALDDDFDLVYASMSPFETATAAARIARAHGVPWVADLRDPWALDEWTVYPTGLHRAAERLAMRRRLRSARAVILNTPEAGRVVARALPELAGRIEVVPNGWDADDFAGPAPARADDRFRIVYTGFSHGGGGRGGRLGRRLRSLLGGTTPGIDAGARSHRPLLEALRLLAAREPELAGQIEVHLAGPVRDGGAGLFPVHDHGYLSHGDAVALMRSADLLFLPMHALAPGWRTRTVPGKLYEYLAAGRPILAALPPGDAADILSRHPDAQVCPPLGPACLAEAIRRAMRTPALLDGTVPDTALPFERARLATRMCEIFARVLSGTPEDTGR